MVSPQKMASNLSGGTRQGCIFNIVLDSVNSVFNRTRHVTGGNFHAVDFVKLRQGSQDVAAGTTHIEDHSARGHLRKKSPFFLSTPTRRIRSAPFMSCSLIRDRKSTRLNSSHANIS